MTTTRKELFGGIVEEGMGKRARFLGAALALLAWCSLWGWAVAGVAAPLGATLRAGRSGPAPWTAPAPGADVVSGPRIAPAPCAC